MQYDGSLTVGSLASENLCYPQCHNFARLGDAHFLSVGCKSAYDKEPEKYIQSSHFKNKLFISER